MEKLKKEKLVVKELTIDESNVDSGVYAVSLVTSPAIESDFIAFKTAELNEKTNGNMFDFVAKQEVNAEGETEYILTGALMIPDQYIYRFDEVKQEGYYVFATAETIKKAAIKFFNENNQHNITHQHQRKVKSHFVFESWIVANSENDKSSAVGLDMPEGTWMISVKVNDKRYWRNHIESGNVKGFSLEGFFNVVETGEFSKILPSQYIDNTTKNKTKNKNIINTMFEKMKNILKFTFGKKEEKVEVKFEEIMIGDMIMWLAENDVIMDSEGGMKFEVYSTDGNFMGYIGLIRDVEVEAEAETETNVETEMKTEEKVEETTEEIEEKTEEAAFTSVLNSIEEKFNSMVEKFNAIETRLNEVEEKSKKTVVVKKVEAKKDEDFKEDKKNENDFSFTKLNEIKNTLKK